MNNSPAQHFIYGFGIEHLFIRCYLFWLVSYGFYFFFEVRLSRLEVSYFRERGCCQAAPVVDGPIKVMGFLNSIKERGCK